MRLAPPGRVLAAVAAVATAGGIGAAVSGTPPATPENPVAHRLPLSLGTPDLVCPGPETLLVPEGGQAVRPKGETSVAVMAADASGTATAGTRLRLGPLGPPAAGGVAGAAAPADGDLAAGLSVRVGSGGIVGGLLRATEPGAAVVESPATGATVPPLLAGVQSTLATTGDLRGLTTTSCAAAVADTWLVGGATTTGHRLRLLLANPAETPATVDVTVHGPDGRVRAPSGDAVDVPGRSSRAVFVDALAPELPAAAVHVTARAGRVQATLHASVLRGVVPGGTDDVAPAAPPSRRQIVPGIALVPGPADADSNAESDADDESDGDAESDGGADDTDAGGAADLAAAAEPGATAVRVAVPGAEEAVVAVRLLGPEGEVRLPRPAATTVPAGGVADIPLSGVPAAVYAAVVTADVPVVAGALVGRARETGPSEFGWAAATRPLTGGRLLTTVPGTNTYAALVAAGRAGRVRLRQVYPGGRLGAVQVLDVPAGRSLTTVAAPDVVGLLVERVTGGRVDAALVATVEAPDGVLISVRPMSAPAVTSRPPPRAVRDDGLGLRGRAPQSSRP